MSFLSYLTNLISKPSPLIPREDRLSVLPDSILCHILSFLPTKHSVATSILSKRWKSLWFSVLAVNLVAKKLSDIENFDPVILLREIKVPIQTLRLKCNVRLMGYRYDEQECIIQSFCDHINPLITGVLQRGLETLELDMKLATSVQTSPLALQSNVFSCKTLTVLKLSHVSIVAEDLPQLNIKTLHLDHVYFISHTDIIVFFSSFHTLEELKTNEVLVEEYIPQRLMIKCLPNLMRATLSDSETIPLFLLSRTLILSIKLRSTHLMDHYDVYRLTQIELFFEFDSKKKWEWMLEMLQHSPKLQHLIINEKTKNDEGEDNWDVPATVPKCLSWQLRTCLIKNYGGRMCELQFAEYVMQNSKVLRTMTIHSSRSINLKEKFLVLQKLSLCPRNCKLIFD